MTVDSVISSEWVTSFTQTSSGQLRLFAFPYAGAGTVVYRNWTTSLPDGVELVSIRLPGRESRLRETPYSQMNLLVTALVDAIIPYLDKPFAFFGHSMGALVAFETVRELRRRGQAIPKHLFISARRAPQLADPDTGLHPLGDAAFVREMQRRYGGIPDAILKTPELLALFVPVLKADFSVIETYRYTPEQPLDCPISVYGGTQDFVLRAGDLEGWREQTERDFQIQKFVGGHFYFQNQPTVLLSTLSAALKSYL